MSQTACLSRALKSTTLQKRANYTIIYVKINFGDDYTRNHLSSVLISHFIQSLLEIFLSPGVMRISFLRYKIQEMYDKKYNATP